MEIDHIIFVVGSGRCGTTLLQDILLDSDDTFSSVTETGLIQAIYDIAPNCSIPNFIHCSRSCYLQNVLFHDDLRQELRKFVLSILNLIPRSNKQHIFIEKTPKNLWFVDFINSIFLPFIKIHFIHIYRNGYDVVNSLMGQEWGLEVNFCVDLWTSSAEKVINKEYPTSVINIKYEDLILNPVGCFDKINTFCGLSVVPKFTPTKPKSYPKFDTNIVNPQSMHNFNEAMISLGYKICP